MLIKNINILEKNIGIYIISCWTRHLLSMGTKPENMKLEWIALAA